MFACTAQPQSWQGNRTCIIDRLRLSAALCPMRMIQRTLFFLSVFTFQSKLYECMQCHTKVGRQAVLTKSCHWTIHIWCTAPNLFELLLVPCYCMHTKSTAVLTESYYLVYCTSTLWYWSSRTAYSCNFPMQLHAVLDQPTNKVSGNTSVAESGLLLWLIWGFLSEKFHLSSHTGCFFFNWYPPKKLKYGKPRLGVSTLT